MSNRFDSDVTAIGEFQSRYGSLPGPQNAQAACAQWENLCTALLKEREEMRTDLQKAKAERDAYKSLYLMTEPKISYTKEEILSQIGKNPSLQELIADIEREAGRDT